MNNELTLDAIRANAARLQSQVRRTPVAEWDDAELIDALGAGTRVSLKLELMQVTGTFKARGALTVMQSQPAERLANGVCAFSAGNHAIAVAWAARRLGVSAKVVMMQNANPFRVARCRELGAEILQEADVHAAFERVQQIERDEGRLFVHPFEGPYTALGTATLGLELCEQLPDLDAVIVPIGGGGLCAGVSTAVKLARPDCRVYGVEPYGADNMYRSLQSGSPQANEAIRSIADSLGPPASQPYSFELCRRHVDEIVRVEDDALREGMQRLARDMKLIVEPAGAAATAALLGPLRERVAGRHVAVIVCGSNIDLETYSRLLTPA